MTDGLLVTCALLASLGGLLSLWRVWGSGRNVGVRITAAIALWALSTAIWVGRFGAEIGVPLALETAALIAFAFIMTRIERRPPRESRPRTVVQPAQERWRIAKGWAQAAVAGPLGLVAAMGIAVVIATMAPMAEQTRLILAGLIVPTLWAIGIAWVVCRRRLPLQATTFAVIGLTGFGLTYLAGA